MNQTTSRARWQKAGQFKYAVSHVMRGTLGSRWSALVDLNQVTAPCADLDASVAFYRRLGLRLIVNDPPDYARFECPAGNATFSLHRVPVVSHDHGIVVYFELDDLDTKVRQLTAAGLQFESGPQDQPWLWREAHLRDPAGNRVCLFHAGENRRNPPWRLPELR